MEITVGARRNLEVRCIGLHTHGFYGRSIYEPVGTLPGRWLGIGVLAGQQEMQLHVGNLSVLITSEDLHELAKVYGTVVSASVVVNGIDGVSEGFGFIELSTPEEGRAAIAGLNGREVNGQTLTVDEAEHGPVLY